VSDVFDLTKEQATGTLNAVLYRVGTALGRVHGDQPVTLNAEELLRDLEQRLAASTEAERSLALNTPPVEFQPWPKIPRLNREIVVTEKIDGSNAAVVIVEVPFGQGVFPDYNRLAIVTLDGDDAHDEEGYPLFEYHVYAQSRTRLLRGGKGNDNFGFAAWVKANAEELVTLLGKGRHYGEWWGAGIQRGYGLTKGEKRFSLFNTHRFNAHDVRLAVAGTSLQGVVSVVPVLYRGLYSPAEIDFALFALSLRGSVAAPNFMRPEGIVVFHTAAGQAFKVTLEGDEAPKTAPKVPDPVDRFAAVRDEHGLAA
jgi:hypothetical protein